MAILGGENRRDETLGDFIRSLIGEETFMQSSVADDLYQEGLEEGLEQGRKEGREQGRKEGREQGRKEGRQQGREKLLELAAAYLSDEELDDLRAIDDLDELKERVLTSLPSEESD